MKITEAWLRSNATPTSYQKGEDYVDEVTKLIKRNNTYTAQVYGSDIYHVTIEMTAFDANCFCSCPYDWGGICKHVVAVGLKIIEGEVEESEIEAEAEEIAAGTDMDYSDAATFYDDIFKTTDATTREQFLRQLFQKDNTLRAQFQQFINSETKEIELENIKDIAEALREELNDLDFDIEEMSQRGRGKGQRSYDYYDEDNDDLSEAAIEMIAETIEPYGKKAQKYLEKGNLMDATRVVLGMYEATFGLETPYFEEYDFFDDLEAEAGEVVDTWLRDLGEICQKIVKNEEAVQQVIDLIFQRWKHFYQGNGANEHGIDYNLMAFDAYFMGLASTIATGEYLLALLEDHERYAYGTSNLYLHLAKVVQDEDLKLKILEDFASNSTTLAEQLLQYYFDKNDLNNFYRIARQSFNIFPNQMDKYLLEKISPEIDLAFYLEVLRYFTKERNNIEGFKKLKEFWTPRQKEDFIQSNRLNAAFYVQMLEVEQRYEEILKVVKTNKDTWGFDKLTRPILNIYPEEMLELYFKRAYLAMGPGAQDRRKYQQVAKDLKPILQIEQLQDKRKALIKQLKNKYRYLPAFLDEMAKAGF